MRKKILIIIAVAGLDLVFIFLMGGGLHFGEVMRIAEQSTPSQRYLVLRPKVAEPVVELVDAAPENIHQTSKSISQIRKRRPISDSGIFKKANAVQRIASRSTKRRLEQPKFTDTIIWLKSSNPARRDAIKSERIIYTEPALPNLARIEPTKRSFFSRAVPIVKKPFDWVKELVSKLK